jgi:hypothetical protein
MLGRRCPPSADAQAGASEPAASFCVDWNRPEFVFMCGRGQRIAGRLAPVDDVQDRRPTGAELLCSREFRTSDRARLGAWLVGKRLWISATTCGACRRILGWHFVGDVESLRAEHLRILQGRLGLPPKPLLRTVEAWRKALAACPLPARDPVEGADAFPHLSSPSCDPKVKPPAGWPKQPAQPPAEK